jgi:hypothetical protein
LPLLGTITAMRVEALPYSAVAQKHRPLSFFVPRAAKNAARSIVRILVLMPMAPR